MTNIFFDMDGTLFDLYGVAGWLDALTSYDPTPYKIAPVIYNMSCIARYLNLVQAGGCKLGIISWLSRNSTKSYDRAVTAAKLASLKRHLPSVKWDYIHIVSYGTPKEQFMLTSNDILFDDEERNRINWGGRAYTPDNIIKVLKELV